VKGRESGRKRGRGRDLPDQCQSASYASKAASYMRDISQSFKFKTTSLKNFNREYRNCDFLTLPPMIEGSYRCFVGALLSGST